MAGMRNILGIENETVISSQVIDQVRLPIRLAGMGLRNSVRLASAAYWSSWADILPTLRDRFPILTNRIITRLEADPGDGTSLQDASCLRELQEARANLIEMGQTLPTWTEIMTGTRPRPPEGHGPDPDEWQHGRPFATSAVLE